MVSPSIPNLLEALSSSDANGNPFFENNNYTEFPLIPYSNDYPDSKLLKNEDNESDHIFARLLEAACFGNDDIFRTNPSIPKEIVDRLDGYQGAAPLHYACMNGHLSVVTFLKANGADVDIWDANRKVTPIICAAAFGHHEIVNYLLKNNCDINAGLDEQSSALLWAVRRSHVKVVKCLLRYNASQISSVLYSQTPVHAAVMSGCTKILEMLITAKGVGKADFCMGAEKMTPLHYAASGEYQNSLEMCKLLLDKGKASVNAASSSGKTPLHLAAGSYDVDVVKLLLDYKANVNSADMDGRTPLFYVISDAGDCWRCLKLLCEDGRCNVNHQDVQGHTALHIAAFKEASAAAQLLLLNGADFSLKAKDGFSALSILCRKIPTTEKLISRALDRAVKISNRFDSVDGVQDLEEMRQNCKVKVNFNYIVASSRLATMSLSQSPLPPPSSSTKSYPVLCEKTRTLKPMKRVSSSKSGNGIRNETAKVKCLIDENLNSLLLHPVVESFLVLKWHKTRPIFIANFVFKLILVVLFSTYVQLPYTSGNKPIDSYNKAAVETFSNGSSPKLEELPNNHTVYNGTMKDAGFEGDIPAYYSAMYYVIVTLAAFNGIMELAGVIRAPKTELRTVGPWTFIAVTVIMVYLCPTTLGKSGDKFYRTIAAMGLCMAWADIWIYMGRFPKFGLSIGVFLRIFRNFTNFIAPHFCLLAGFVLSFTLLFPQNGEYTSILITLAKGIRIMAGDNSLPEDAVRVFSTDKDSETDVIAYYLINYIYTAFVLLVGIVLMNMLIGLAVHDIQGICAEASIHRFTKQTVLLNALDTNFIGRWVPQRFMAKYIKLFPSAYHSKILTIKPYDARDTCLSIELKQALVNISNNRPKEAGNNSSNACVNEFGESSPTSPKNIQVWVQTVNKLIAKKESEQKILMRKVDALMNQVNLLIETMNGKQK